LTLFLTLSVYSQTIKDISNIVGIRENQLIGNGLVVGLREGDKSPLTAQMLKNLMQNSFLNSAVAADSAAAVLVTATLPAFARQGDKIKVNVSAIAGGEKLDGGLLVLTQLKGIDGKVYAIAQGRVVGIELASAKTNREKSQTPSGYIYAGAIVEKELPYSLRNEKFITLSLLEHNAKVATSIEDKINEKYGENLALAYDTRTIEVTKPSNISIIRFISEIQDIKLDTNMKNKIIIDTRKEIIVAGADITINPVTISRENFTIRIKKSNLSDKAWEDPLVNVGIDLGDDTKVAKIPGELIPAIDIDNALVNTKNQPTVSDLMRAMKTMKLGITEIIETIKMLDNLGAINADVEMVR